MTPAAKQDKAKDKATDPLTERSPWPERAPPDCSRSGGGRGRGDHRSQVREDDQGDSCRLGPSRVTLNVTFHFVKIKGVAKGKDKELSIWNASHVSRWIEDLNRIFTRRRISRSNNTRSRNPHCLATAGPRSPHDGRAVGSPRWQQERDGDG